MGNFLISQSVWKKFYRYNKNQETKVKNLIRRSNKFQNKTPKTEKTEKTKKKNMKNHLPPTAYHLPPTAYHLPPTAYRLPPTA